MTAARNRERLLKDFLDYRRSAIKLGQQGTREYPIPAARIRARRAAGEISPAGHPGERAEEPFQSGANARRGTLIVPLAQPAGRLARNLLDPDVKMDDAF